MAAEAKTETKTETKTEPKTPAGVVPSQVRAPDRLSP